MNAINFVVRTRTGSIERGVVGADDLGYLIDASGGRDVSINLHRSDLRSYDRAENDLHILLADGGDVPLSVETRLSGAAWFEVMRRPSSVQAGLFDGGQEELA
jgi:hypothetical protein